LIAKRHIASHKPTCGTDPKKNSRATQAYSL
jgi:hypothetical protein